MKETNIGISSEGAFNYDGVDYFLVDEDTQQGVAYNYIVVKHGNSISGQGVYKWETDEVKMNEIIHLINAPNADQLLVPFDKCKLISSLKCEKVPEYSKNIIKSLLKPTRVRRTKEQIERDDKKDIRHVGRGFHSVPTVRCIETGKEYYSCAEAQKDTGEKLVAHKCNGIYPKFETLHFEWINKKGKMNGQEI